MQKLPLLLAASAFLASSLTAQLTGTKTIGVDYVSVAQAITTLNAQGVGAGGVIFNVPSGWTETAPAGGFAITATGTAARPIVFQKSGAGTNPTFTASAAHAAGSLTDAVFKLIGTDYVTLDRFTLQENAANLNAAPASNNMTEWGVALLSGSTTNGAQNNTIRNCTVSLNRTYLNTFGIYSNTCHSASAPTVPSEATSAAGANSQNRIHANTISNVNFGIVFIGSGTTPAAIDTGNDVGGDFETTGNALTNWGGGAAPSAYVALTAGNCGIYLNQQIDENVSHNSIASAALAQAVATSGILKDYSVAPPTSGTFSSLIHGNTVTVTNHPTAATTGAVTGILNQGLTSQLPTATHGITANIVQNCVLGGSVSTTNDLIGILNLSAPGTLNMHSNVVVNLSLSATSATTGRVIGLSNGGAAATLNMNSNVLRGLSSVANSFSASVTGLANSGAVTNAINLNGNQLGNASGGFFSSAVALSSSHFGISNSGGAQNCAISIQSNDFRGINFAAGTNSSVFLCRNTAGTFSQNISGNTFTNLTLNTSGSVTLIDNNVTVPVSGGSKSINNNSIVTAFQKTVSGGAVAGYFDSASSVAGVTVTNNNNDLSNITVVGATQLIGWQNTDGGAPNKTVSGNTMTNWTGGTGFITAMAIGFGTNQVSGNVIRNISSAGNITGLSTSSGTVTLAQNRIHSLSSSGVATVTGLATGGTPSNPKTVVRNLIYDLQGTHASALVLGMSFSATTTASNNLIGDLRAPAANSPNDAVIGILLANTGLSANLYYNTVHLTGTSSGTNFNSSGVSSLTTGTVLLRNNLISNQITPTGTGRATAWRRSAVSLTNYSTSSNQNAFYAGTPGPAHVIYFDGTNTEQTITGFQTRVSGREALSVTENPNFLSLVGSDSAFLHIDPTIATQLEGGGGAIAGVTDDYDGEARQAIPDIGADEFAGLSNDATPPLISFTPLGNTLAGLNQTLNTTITDPRGVPTAGAGLPRLYYSINGGAYTAVTAVSGGGGAYSFTFGAAASTPGDIVRYFVVAQDGVAIPNVGAQPSTGAGGYSSNPPAAATPPSTPNQFTTLGAIGGARNVGVGGDFATLADAALALNSSALTGPVTLYLTDSSYPVSPTPIVFGPIAGTSVSNTVTIRPAPGVTTTITGAASSDCVITLNGADWIIIEGSNAVGGLTRDLTVLSANAGTAAVICLKSVGSDGATDNFVRSTNLAGTSPTGTYAGIHSGGATVGSLGIGNHSNRYINNDIRRVRVGLSTMGASAAAKNTGTQFVNNSLGAPAPDNIGRQGVYAGYEDGIFVTSNVIENIAQSTGNIDSIGVGMGVNAVATGGSPTLEVTNSTVSRNRIGTITHSGSYSAIGVVVGAAASGTNRIFNNAIYRIQSNGTGGDFTAGIYALGGTGSTTVIYYNSICLSGYLLPVAVGSRYPTFALALGAGDPVIFVRNNIFLNAASNDSDLSFAIGTASSTFANLTSYDNDFAVGAGSGFFVGRTGSLTNAGSNHEFLSQWQATTGRDAGSLALNPLFQSTTNLRLQAGSPMLGAGAPIPGFNTDLTGTPRSLTAPSLGAYEFGSVFPGISFAALLSTTSLDNRTLTFTVTDSGGVPTSGIGLPVLYYRKGSTGPHTAATSTWISGSSYSALIDYTPLGGVSVGDVIEYFVAAQNNSGNVSVVPVGASNFSADPPACITPPVPPAAYAISGVLSGIYNIGAGQSLTSLTNIGGFFEMVNAGVLAGDVTVNITSDLTTEPGFRTLHQWAEAGAGGYTLRIKPTGVARTISGDVDTALIWLNGADRVVLDGALNGGTDRSLTIANRASAGSAVAMTSPSASDGANQNTVQNCLITAGRDGFGIVAGGALGGNALAPNSNNTIRNNAVSRAAIGFYAFGPNVALDQNWLITGNNFGSAAASDKLGLHGIIALNAQNLTVTGNTISGIAASATQTIVPSGIGVGGSTNGAVIDRNEIKDIRMANPTRGANGIRLNSASTAANVTVSNNMISDIVAPGVNDLTTQDNAYGIVADSGGGYRIYYNTVNLFTDQAQGASNPAALNIVGARPALGLNGVNAAGAVDVRNNILVNSASVGFCYAVINSSPAGATVFSAIDYNMYYGVFVGFQGSVQASLANWRSATGQDTHSLEGDPIFFPGLDFHLQPQSPAANAGTPLAGVSTDFDGQPRSALRPEIGADEIARSANASSLVVSVGSLTPAFAANTLAYGNTVANGVAGQTVTPTALDPNATIEVRVNGGAFVPVASGMPSANLPLSLGNNPIEVRLTGEFGSPQRTYVVNTLRQAVLAAGTLNLDVSQGYARTITQAELLSAATFSPGFAPNLTTAGPLSVQGGTIGLVAGVSTTYHVPAPAFTGADSFQYLLTNSLGQTASGTINLNVVAPPFPPRSASVTRAGGTLAAGFTGAVPGLVYRIEYSPNLLTPWTALLNAGLPVTATADGTGSFNFTDPTSAPPKGFYRAVTP